MSKCSLLLFMIFLSCSTTHTYTSYKYVNEGVIGVEIERPPYGGEIFKVYLGMYDDDLNLLKIIPPSVSGYYDSHFYFINLDPGNYSLIFGVYKAGKRFIINKSMNDAYVFPEEMIKQSQVKIKRNEQIYLGKFKVIEKVFRDDDYGGLQKNIIQYLLKEKKFRKVLFFSDKFKRTYDKRTFRNNTQDILKGTNYPKNIFRECSN